MGFPADGLFEVGRGIADGLERAEMGMGVDGFRVGRGAKQPGRLLESFLVGLVGKGQILAVCLRFSGKSLPKILLGFTHAASPYF